MASRPVYIAVEGIDGSGTTTHSRLLAKALSRLGLEARIVKEPSQGPLGRLIRGILRGEQPGGLEHNPILALLFAADRLHQLYYTPNSVASLLSRGVSVVSDRSKYSSLAYQATGSDPAPWSWVEAVNQAAMTPHVLVYLDVSPEAAAERLRERRRLELYEALDRLREAWRGYQRLLQQLWSRPEYCPGDRPPWVELASRAGLDVEAAYPGGACYPALVVVREEEDGEELPVGEVAARVASGVEAALRGLGLHPAAGAGAAAEEAPRGVRVRVHRRRGMAGPQRGLLGAPPQSPWPLPPAP